MENSVPLSVVDFDYIRNLVRQRSAIVLESDKSYLAESRLLPLARHEGFSSVDALMAGVRANKVNGLAQKVVEAMTTNETSFFRDIQPFEIFREKILPELLQKRAVERRLCIWCAACSTGQEPYTIAMLLCEHFGGLNGWRFDLLATDLATTVLEKAKQGCYTQMEVNRGLSARQLVKYFQRQGLHWQIADDLRRMVQFRPLNLIEPWPSLPALDVIFLRNVLIYFDVPTKKAILGKVRQSLRPDGYLFLGGAETTMNLDDRFERLDFQRAGCYRLRAS